MSINPVGSSVTGFTTSENPGARGVALLSQVCNVPPSYWRPSGHIPEKRKTVGLAVEQLERFQLADEPNLTRLLRLDDRDCLQLSKALFNLEPEEGQPQGGILLNQQTLTTLFEHLGQNWDTIFFQLREQGILNRDILNILINPENVANAYDIAEGLTSLPSVRFEQYRASIVAAGEHAAKLGEGLRSVYVLQGYEEEIFEGCKNAVLNAPENAKIIADALSRLHRSHILVPHWQRVIDAREHALTLVRAINLLHFKGLLTQDSAIFNVDPQFAEEVAYGLIQLQDYPHLSGREECVYVLVSGDPRGVHAATITRRLMELGAEATFEQFEEIVQALPTSNPVLYLK